MTHGSLFSGIGGFDLAAQWMGWTNVFHCEIAEIPRKILNYHFPESISYADIKATDFNVHRGSIDVLSGGFPCQPFSLAGKRKGKDDDRYLWKEMLRAVCEIQPKWIVGENVFGIVNWSDGLVFEEVCSDLETEGYEVQSYILPAASTGAPHQRMRCWFVAYRNGAGFQTQRAEQQAAGFEQYGKLGGHAADTKGGNNRRIIGSMGSAEEKNGEEWKDDTFSKSSHFGNEGVSADTNGIGLRRKGDGIGNAEFISQNDTRTDWQTFPTVSPICHGDDGISDRLDNITFSKWRQESIKGGGNAVVPQLVYRIFDTIQQYENL